MPPPTPPPITPSSSQTFYNDHATTTNHPLSSVSRSSTTPFSPFPFYPSQATSPQTLSRLAALERKLDSLLFILSAQSASLTNLNSKFERLCAISGVEVPDEKPVEQRMRDYEMKFERARHNADEAVLERKRTISDVAAAAVAAKAGVAIASSSAGGKGEGAKPDAGVSAMPVGMQADRKRVISITRSCRDVVLAVSLRVYIDSVSVVDETVSLPAMAYEKFEKLLKEIFRRTKDLYDARSSTPEAQGLDLTLDSEDGVKWVLKLQEDGNVATLSKSPMRLTRDDHVGNSAEMLYKGWYWRNVLRGMETEYVLEFRCDLKSHGGKG